MPPRSKNGSTISSQVSASTCDGGGSVAPALRHSSSQTSSDSARTMSGGSTWVGDCCAVRARMRLVRVPRCGLSGRTFAAPWRGGYKATAASVLRTGMFIGDGLRF